MRSEFEKAFPIPAHWIEFNEKLNKYYCPYSADYEASKYQAKWEVWQHRQTEVEELNQHIKRLESKLDEVGSDRQGLVGQVNAVKQLIQEYHQHSYREADDFVFYLEQALKGGGE